MSLLLLLIVVCVADAEKVPSNLSIARKSEALSEVKYSAVKTFGGMTKAFVG